MSHTLNQPAIFNLDERFMARWSADGKRVLSQTGKALPDELKGKLSTHCTHVKGHGGVKKSLRLLHRVIPEFRYAARFDVARYYESIDYDVLLSQLKKMQVSQHSSHSLLSDQAVAVGGQPVNVRVLRFAATELPSAPCPNTTRFVCTSNVCVYAL